MQPQSITSIRDITIGVRFGRLVVTGPDIRRRGACGTGPRYWPCQCDCGQTVTVVGTSLTSGETRSCGCLQRELTAARARTHGATAGSHRTALYYVWTSMRARCYQSTRPEFVHYGGRGITVCDAWRDNFAAFQAWAVMAGYQRGLSLDRRDNDGHYTPANCRWADRVTQANNMRSNRHVVAFGETKTPAQWVRDPRCRVNIHTLRLRIFRLGWPPERAIQEPARYRPRRISA